MNFYFVTVVWGVSYTDMFLNFCIPSLLSPCNLASFRDKSGAVYKIYTTPDDAERISVSPVFLKLSEIIPTELHYMDNSDFEGGGHECYKKAINAAVKDHAAFVQLAPDMIWADGIFVGVQEIVARGKKAIMISINYTAKETFAPEFVEHFYLENEIIAPISSRALVKLSLDHPTNRATTHFWDSKNFTSWPGWLFWAVKNEGVLARRFHLHPLMLCPSKEFMEFLPSFDGSQYIPITYPNFDDIYIVEDSDEMFAIELCDAKVQSHPSFPYVPGNKSSCFNVAYWAISWWNTYHSNTNTYHLKFFRYKIRMHYTDISPKWKKIEDDSDKIVHTICFLIWILA